MNQDFTLKRNEKKSGKCIEYKHGIGLEPIAESTQMTLIYKVHNNTIQGGADSDITGSDTTTIRPDYFLYAGGGSFPKPDLFTGKMIWDIRDNKSKISKKLKGMAKLEYTNRRNTEANYIKST